MQLGMVSVNVYYFFIRRGCLPQCLANLFSAGSKVMTVRDRKTAVEFLAIMYISGIMFIPGGHYQFQLWYQDLLPLAFMMTGLPVVVWFKLFLDVYPAAEFENKELHQVVIMAFMFWLLTVGPSRNLWPRHSARKVLKQD